jgi:hypothetical protein
MNRRVSTPTVICILFSVVFTSLSPSHHGCVWLLPVISILTLYRLCMLTYAYDWRGFMGANKKTSKGLLYLISRCSIPLPTYTPALSVLQFSYNVSEVRGREHYHSLTCCLIPRYLLRSIFLLLCLTFPCLEVRHLM